MNRILSSEVINCPCPMRIDLYLAKRFNFQSREEWKKEIKRGKILLNGLPITNNHKIIKEGDNISYFGDRTEEPIVDTNFSIVFEDSDIIVINKTGNLPVHPSGIFLKNTLQTILEEKYGHRIHPVHRIDRETSGAIIFAKNPETASKLSLAWGNAKKTYLAIVHGTISDDHFVIDVPIGSAYRDRVDGDKYVRKKRLAYAGAPETARTTFKVQERYNGYTLVKAFPETGRLHQIRVHLKYAGYPIVGDKIYGKDEKFYISFITDGLTDELLKELEMPRCALHSYKVTLRLGSEEKLKFKAPLLEDMSCFLKKQTIIHR